MFANAKADFLLDQPQVHQESRPKILVIDNEFQDGKKHLILTLDFKMELGKKPYVNIIGT